MHPKLIENAAFLRYYQRWQGDPTSIVFAPIAEFCLQYTLIDQAIAVCEEGLAYHPQLVSGLLTLAKAYQQKGERKRAHETALKILHIVPDHHAAKEFLIQLPRAAVQPVEVVAEFKPWQTVTMAQIYLDQGHYAQAAEIYTSILKVDPANRAAQEGLVKVTQLTEAPQPST